MQQPEELSHISSLLLKEEGRIDYLNERESILKKVQRLRIIGGGVHVLLVEFCCCRGASLRLKLSTTAYKTFETPSTLAGFFESFGVFYTAITGEESTCVCP